MAIKNSARPIIRQLPAAFGFCRQATNNDGVENGVAWALGAADPSANAIGLLPTLDNTSDPTYVITP